MKLDLYAEHKAEYAAPRKPVLLETEPALYLSIDGTGEPAGEEFQRCIGALYSVAFTMKMASKADGQDYKVCGLEGLWEAFGPGNWKWRLVIRTPEFIGAKQLAAAQRTLLAKGKPEDVTRVRLEKIREGSCIQMLHVGPYDAEQPTIEAMKAFAAEQGLRCSGAHHEIYVSDPRRVPPERLRTILRQPVARA